MTRISPIDASHPLVGVWVEEGNPDLTTTVEFTIKVRAGQFRVTGVDESDGVSLRISNTVWDGKKLRFETVFPPTGHKASHEFWVTKKKRGRHRVAYSDEDGSQIVDLLWKKQSAAPMKP